MLVFPLPDRGAVTDLRMTAAGRTVVARLREREAARAEYDAAIADLRATGLRVECGVFQADMAVASINDGPVTILIDSNKVF